MNLTFDLIHMQKLQFKGHSVQKIE